jgi:hypothetical protein
MGIESRLLRFRQTPIQPLIELFFDSLAIHVSFLFIQHRAP